MGDPATLSNLWAVIRIAVISILLSGLCLHADAASIHPALQSSIESGQSSRVTAVWVFFADRGFSDASARDTAVAEAAERMTEDALARRARSQVRGIGEIDLPVAASYKMRVGEIASIRNESRWLNAVSVDVPLGEIGRLAALPFVTEIRPVARGRSSYVGPERAPDGRLLEWFEPGSGIRIPEGTGRDDFYGPSYDQLNEIDVISAHAAGYHGARVNMMMLDTGFRKDHNAFAQSTLIAERDFVFGDDNVQNEAEDDQYQHYHGTAVWGAAGGYAPGALIGPGYRASFILAKTEDIRSETQVEEDNYVAALEWGDSLGVMVTSASLSYMNFDDGSGWTYEELDGDTAPITRAIDRAAALGIICVNSIGNGGPEPGTLKQPADADTILSVGSVNPDGEISGFSSRGPRVDGMIKPEVVARGEDTWAADFSDPESYFTVSGTSLSAPLVSGSCAIVLEAHPEWSAFHAMEVLKDTAQRWGPPDNEYGYGRIQVWAAIQSEPVIYPVPFSLVGPDEGTVSVASNPVTFTWNQSSDPQGGAISYELWIDDDPDFASPILIADLADTSYTVPLPPNGKQTWRVVAEDLDGYRRISRTDRSLWVLESSGTPDLPFVQQVTHFEAAPNPWRHGSRLRWYTPPESSHESVRLTILDPVGRCLLRERIEVNSAGWNEWWWEPRSADGSLLPAGVYLALLETSGHAARTKIVLTR